MAFLYGDSTESGLELNYIELLRDFLDFGAQLLMSEHRIVTAARAGTDQHASAERELERLDQLTRAVSEALDRCKGSDPKSPADQCASSIRGLATEAIRRASENIKGLVAEADRQVALKSQRERGGNLRLLERFLRDHELPEQTQRVDLRFDEGAGRYEARVTAAAPPALEWSFALELPQSSLFGRPVKVGHFDEQLEVQVPEAAGLMRKRMKLRPHKLGGMYIWALERGRGMTTLLLRAAPHADEAGLNVSVGAGASQVSLVRVQKGGEESPPFEPADGDGNKLIELCTRVQAEADALAGHRSTLIEASFDGRPLASHEDPAALVRRLVQRLAPVIQEIGRRSLSSDELVLKRVLADDRREEIFASKADLRAKLSPVPASLREVFAPLGLGVLDTVGDDDCTTELDLSQERSLQGPAVMQSGIIGDDEETAVAMQPLPEVDPVVAGFPGPSPSAARSGSFGKGARPAPSTRPPAPPPGGAEAKSAAAKPAPAAPAPSPAKPAAPGPAQPAANGSSAPRPTITSPAPPTDAAPPATTAQGSIAPPPQPSAGPVPSAPRASAPEPDPDKPDSVDAALAELESESL